MKPITPKQTEQFSRFVTDAAGPSTTTALEQLRDDGEISLDGLQLAISRGGELKSRLIPFIKAMAKEMAMNIKGCVKRIFSNVDIAKTDGTENLAQAGEVFSWVDPDFNNYGCNVPSKPTKKMMVEVHEMVEDGDFRKIFGGFNVSLDQLCLTQNQIKRFVQDHRDKLRTEGYATFFLFKENNEFFVAFVCLGSDGRLSVHVYRFSSDGVWYAEYRHRIVVPQLTA